MYPDMFAIGIEAMRRAAQKRIELLPVPKAFSEKLEPYFSTSDPKGHYLYMPNSEFVGIMAIDDYRSAAGTYSDLIPGFALKAISELPCHPSPDDPARERKFIAIEYERRRGEPMWGWA